MWFINQLYNCYFVNFHMCEISKDYQSVHATSNNHHLVIFFSKQYIIRNHCWEIYNNLTQHNRNMNSKILSHRIDREIGICLAFDYYQIVLDKP